MTTEEIVKLINQLDPKTDYPYGMLNTIYTKFDLVGKTWCRLDAEGELGRDLTDDEWETVSYSDDWQSLSEPTDTDSYAVQLALELIMEEED
jgi:hypothetical protein